MERIICLVIGYVFRLFQTGHPYGKCKRIDIHQHGSGDSGSTNALKVMGVRAGLIVFLRDFFKTVIPCFLVGVLSESQPGYLYVWILYAGFKVIPGHNFPFYLNFKGGREIATAVGIVTSLGRGLMLLCLVTFVLVMAVTKYISPGSLIVSAILVVQNVVMEQIGTYGLSAAARPEFYGISAVIAAMAFWRHRANIIRLVQDREDKVGAKKK